MLPRPKRFELVRTQASQKRYGLGYKPRPASGAMSFLPPRPGSACRPVRLEDLIALFVNLFTVTNLDNQNNQLVIFNAT
jgi:hypothetical protein